jgi:hypothetical protein
MRCDLGKEKIGRPSFLSPKERQEYDRMLALYKEKKDGQTVMRTVARTMMRMGIQMKSNGCSWHIVY